MVGNAVKPSLQEASYQVASAVIGSFGERQHHKPTIDKVLVSTRQIIDRVVVDFAADDRDVVVLRRELQHRFSREQIQKWEVVCKNATDFGMDILTMVVDEKRYGINPSLAQDIIGTLEGIHDEPSGGAPSVLYPNVPTSTSSMTSASRDSSGEPLEDTVSNKQIPQKPSTVLKQEHSGLELQSELERLQMEYESYKLRRQEALESIERLDREQRARDQLRIEILSNYPAEPSIDTTNIAVQDRTLQSSELCDNISKNSPEVDANSQLGDRSRLSLLSNEPDSEKIEPASTALDHFISQHMGSRHTNEESLSTHTAAKERMLSPDDDSIAAAPSVTSSRSTGVEHPDDELLAAAALLSKQDELLSEDFMSVVSDTNLDSQMETTHTDRMAPVSFQRSPSSDCDFPDDEADVPSLPQAEKEEEEAKTKVLHSHVVPTQRNGLTRHRFFEEEEEYPDPDEGQGAILVLPTKDDDEEQTIDEKTGVVGGNDPPREQIKILGVGSAARLEMLGTIQEE